MLNAVRELEGTMWGTSLMTLTLLTTLISGYVVIVYVAGADMTRSKVVIVNSLFLFMSITTLWSLIVISSRAAEFEDIAYAMISGPAANPESRGDVAVAVIVAFSVAVTASLKFMWDVRHSKTD